MIQAELANMLREQAKFNFPGEMTEQAEDDGKNEQQSSTKAPESAEAALSILGLFKDGVPVTAAAYRSVAGLLHYYGHYNQAESICRNGLEECEMEMETQVEKLGTLNILAKVLLELGKTPEALRCFIDNTQLFESESIPGTLKRVAMITKARRSSEGKRDVIIERTRT